MTESIDIVVPAVGGAEAAAASIREIGTAADDTTAKMEGLKSTAAGTGDAMTGAGAGAQHLKDDTEQASEGAAHLEEGLNSLKETLLALGLALGVKEWIELTDTFTTMTNRLEQVTSSEKQLNDVYKELLGVANEVHEPLQQVSQMFVAIEKNADALGVTTKGAQTIITTIGDAMIAAGKSGESMTGVTEALSRAFETGSFQGRGWITILRGAPELAIALANSFGMSTKAFGAAMTAGTIAMSSVMDHLIQLHDQFAASAGKMEVTVGMAWQNMKNSVMDFFGASDRATGLSNALAQAILFISRNAEIVMPVITALGGAITVMGVAAGLTALSTLAMLSPFVMIAGALTAATVLVLAFGNEIKLTADGSITLLGALRGIFSLLWQTIQGGASLIMAGFNALNTLTGGFLTSADGARSLRAALMAMAGVAIGAWAIGAIGGIAPLATAIGVVTVAVLGFVAAADLYQIACTLLSGGSVQEAINAAKTFNDTLVTTAVNMKNQFVTAMQSGTQAMGPLSEAAENAKHALDVFGDNSQSNASKVKAAHEDIGGSAKHMADRVVGAFGTMQDAAGNWVGEISSDSAKAQSAMDSVKGPSMGGGGGGGGGGSTDIMGGTNPLDAGQAGTAELGGRGDYLQSLHQLQMDGYYDLPSLINGANHGDASSLAKLHSEYNSANEIDKALMKNLFQGGYAGFGGNGAANGGGAPLNVVSGFASGGAFTVGGSGGTDSQLVQFMATPGEDVNIRTPAQQAAATTAPSSGGRPVTVHMTVVTPDAASFGRSQRQIATSLQGKLGDVSRYMR